MGSKFDPYQRRKTPIRDLYTGQRRPTPDENDSTSSDSGSEFEELVNRDGQNTPSKFEVCVTAPWKDFVTNSPTVGWIATHLVLSCPNTRSEVHKVLDRLLDEQTVPEIRKMAGLDQTSEDSSERHRSRTPPLIRYEQGFNESSNFIFSLRERWSYFVEGGQDICVCSGIFSAIATVFTGFYHVLLYFNQFEPSAFHRSLVGWSTVFALNGVASSFAVWPAYKGMKGWFYAVEWPFKIRPKNPAFKGLWWGVDLLDLPYFWATWSWILGVTGIIFLPLCEWLLSVSRPDTLPPQSTDPTLLNVISAIINRWLMYLCVAFNLAHAHFTLSTLEDDLQGMWNSWKRRKGRMKAGEDPCGPSTSSK